MRVSGIVSFIRILRRSRSSAATVALLCSISLSVRAAEFSVNQFGAIGDGANLDTAAIQKAIDAASKAGGGAVVFKPGVYLTGAIFLKSGVHLRVDEGVELRGVQDLAAYPVMFTRVAGIEMKWPAALINVYEESGVSISGKGVIDGDGKVWWDKYWKMRREEYEPKGLRWAVDYDCMRPRLIQIFRSSKVELSGLTLKRSGFWTVHICYSNDVRVDGVTIRNNIGGRGPSTDGIDIDSSRNILVENCDIECNDDALCLKAGRDADGLRVNRPTENVIVRNSTIRVGAAGVTFGSETSGGIRNVEVYGLKVYSGAPRGILFKSAKTRGGTVENIRIRDVEMEGVAIPVAIDLNWNPSYSYATLPEGMKEVPEYWKVLTEKVPDSVTPHIRNVHISNVRARGAKQAFAVSSYADSPLENFLFEAIQIEAATAGSISNARNWNFEGASIQTADGSKVALKNCESVEGLPQ